MGGDHGYEWRRHRRSGLMDVERRTDSVRGGVTQVKYPAALLGLVALSSVAHAESPDPNAKRLFVAGHQAYSEGRYDVAIRALEAAAALSPSDLLLYDLALAYRKKFL